jgi:hypothetical protein
MPTTIPKTAKHHRDRRATTAAQARVARRGQSKEGQGHETADEVVSGRRAGLRLQEGVVGDVQGDHADRRQKEPVLQPYGAGGSLRLAPFADGAWKPRRSALATDDG